MLIAHDCVGCRSLCRQTLVEPSQRRGDSGVLIAQPVHELDRERIPQRCAIVIGEHHRHRLGGKSANPEEAVGKTIRLLPRQTTEHNPLCEPPQILDKHDPQCDCDRPEFSDCQGLHLLIGRYEAAERRGIESTVGMGNERPGHAEDTWISRKRSFGELG